jgi:glycosyltransferase involved in cell wall biosynthesis
LKIVHTEASCGWGGQEIRILSEATGLIERGHNVHLLCPPQAKIYTEAQRAGLPVTPLPIGRKGVKGIIAMHRWLEQHRPDLVNTHSSTDSWLSALARVTISPGPAIVRTRHISAPIPNNTATRWLYTSGADHIVTTGERLREQLIHDNGFSGERITSIPTGIDTRRFILGDRVAARRRLGLDESALYVGIVATLRSWKGHKHLIQAVAKLDQPNLRLLIVGDGPGRETLTALCQQLLPGERSQLVGHQNNTEDWFRAIDIFCLPSYANEGVPQALMQAMLTALPIVTTPVGSISELISDGVTGLIVPHSQPEMLAAALRRLIDDPPLAARLGAEAHSYALQHCSRETMLDRMEAVFSLATSTRGR